jgi:hypothetical protein
MVERRDVVRYFFHIVERNPRDSLVFVQQQVGE